MHRLIPIATAWGLGWLVYMIAMVLTVYDGVLSLIFQPIVAAIVTSVAVGVALFVGLLFRLPKLGRFWRSSWLWAALLAGASIYTMCFGTNLGLTQVFTNPESGNESTGLQSNVAIASYFVFVFAIANWPARRTDAA